MFLVISGGEKLVKIKLQTPSKQSLVNSSQNHKYYVTSM